MFTHTKEYTDYTPLKKKGVSAPKMGVHISFYSIKKIQSTGQLPTTPYSQVCVCVCVCVCVWGGGGGGGGGYSDIFLFTISTLIAGSLSTGDQ